MTETTIYQMHLIEICNIALHMKLHCAKAAPGKASLGMHSAGARYARDHRPSALLEATDLVCNEPLVPLAHKLNQLPDCLVELFAHGLPVLLVLILHHPSHLLDSKLQPQARPKRMIAHMFMLIRKVSTFSHQLKAPVTHPMAHSACSRRCTA